jgi:hypothetical protein
MQCHISEWYWKCVLQGYAVKVAAIVAGLLSTAVVWSEVTFFNKEPVLSLFAHFLSLAKVNYDYFTIEVSGVFILCAINCQHFINSVDSKMNSQISQYAVFT